MVDDQNVRPGTHSPRRNQSHQTRITEAALSCQRRERRRQSPRPRSRPRSGPARRRTLCPRFSTSQVGKPILPSSSGTQAGGTWPRECRAGRTGEGVHEACKVCRRRRVQPNMRARLAVLRWRLFEHAPCHCRRSRTSAPVCPHGRQNATSEQSRSNNAQTPGNTRHHQGPEDEARHHDRRPCTVCKTSIPGSNPGGASIFPEQN